MSNTERETALTLARDSLTLYVKEEKFILPPKNLPQLFYNPRGAFVSIKDIDGNLRGCIGTLEPTKENLAYEIIQNAVSAGTNDPRFPEVLISEINKLQFSVDVISPLEYVSDTNQLDAQKYGVVIEKDYRRGVLLPDLEGVDTVFNQLRIASQKVDLSLDEQGIKIYRFKVTRFSEG
ncbi:AmmeMemoRadiSam system protein A [Natranaerobius trueperi]|uniref:AmmeMemoRadiSam system protein A n=1 Tax=Natranaerobius trueperi TaxID=759412 RepID=A0A226C242_9FIRM|nr:AmmeMemoRadiSam system protein A [Natranaerobius trueperi]OWZ84450.1 AmmeMemoRadiSam system protein A [Natranaerobius trueperi]